MARRRFLRVGGSALQELADEHSGLTDRNCVVIPAGSNPQRVRWVAPWPATTDVTSPLQELRPRSHEWTCFGKGVTETLGSLLTAPQHGVRQLTAAPASAGAGGGPGWLRGTWEYQPGSPLQVVAPSGMAWNSAALKWA